MSDVKGGGPAFPVLDNPGDGALYCRSGGMTLRDYFAAAALTGICANSYTPWSPNIADITDAQIVRAALDLADALIAASKSSESGHE